MVLVLANRRQGECCDKKHNIKLLWRFSALLNRYHACGLLIEFLEKVVLASSPYFCLSMVDRFNAETARVARGLLVA